MLQFAIGVFMLTFQRVAVLSALAAIIGACSGSAPTQTSPAVGLAAAEPATADVVGSSSEALAGTGSCPWGPGECLWPADGVPNFQGGLYVEEAKDTKTEVRVRFPLRGEGVPSSFVLQAQLPSDSGDGTGKLRVELLSDAETPVVLATGSINLAAICAGGDANCATATGNRVLVALQALPTLKPLNAGDFLNLRIFTELTGLRRINLGVVSRAVAATAFVGGSTKRVTIPRKGRTATDTFVTSTLAFIPGVEWTAPPSCQNGLRDVVANDAAQTETDIDCGGPCDPCATGRRCLTSAGCADGLVCRSLKTGVETVGACDPALDTCTCGARFKAGGLCRANELEGEPNRASGRECVSGLCTEGADSIRRCTNPPPATCSNGKVDPKSESGPDCGGTVCAARCGTGVACKVPSDCGASMTCVAGKCNTPLSAAAAAPCTLGTECDSGLCGGSPPVCLAQGTLEPGASCVLAGQCTSGGCTIPRGKTTGTCRQLPKGKDSACTSGADCQSGLCGGTPMLCRAKASLYPGDVCVMNAQCISGSCKNLDGKASTCQPAAPGKACTFAKECNVQVKDGQWDDKFSCTSGVCLGNAEALVSSASLCVSKAVTKATIKSKTKVCTPAPDCSDAFLNGNETDIDRGGPKTGEMVCPRVLTDGLCRVDSDCLDGRCSSSGSCLKPTCRDGVQNGSEAAVDCGGACAPCPAGTPGVKPSGAAGCASGVVVCTKATCSPDEADGWRCAPPRCDDGRVNGSETSKVDDGSECGGSCGPCPVNETPYPKCRTGADCSSGVCKGAKSKVLGSCQPATTRDGIRNGDESDVDCGGTQANVVKCALGRRCSFATDCVTGTTCIGADGNAAGDQPAVGGVCSAATCDDLLATPNGGETDVNCGGPNCGIRCDENQKCKVDSDCLSGGCKKSDKTCLGSSTVDNVRNGTETDIDCGCREAARGSDGTCPDPFARCSLGAACESDDDCVSNACLGGVCSLRACKASTAPAFNAALHRECGRGCANRCATGKACEADVDCASYNCYENVCRERTSSGCTAGFVKSALTGMCEDLEAPPDPADFTYEGDVGQTRVQLTWSRVEAPDGSPVIGYVLAAAADAETVSCDAASKTKEVADAGKDGQGSGVLDNLEPDTDYVITVCAKDQRRNVSKGSIKSIRVRTKPCHAIDHCPSAALSCTNESDQKCRACEAGYYISSAVEEPDTCVACPTGYWCPAPETPGTSGITASDVTADNTLYQWTKCGTDVPGTAQSTPGTTTSNRTCVACEAGYVPNVLSSGNAEECHDIAAPNDAVVLTTPSRSSIRLDWSTPQNPDGSALHHYLVAFHRSGSGQAAAPTDCTARTVDGYGQVDVVEVSTVLAADTLTATFAGLAPEATYGWRVCTVDAAGNISAGTPGSSKTQYCTAIAHCSAGHLSCESETDQTCGACEPGYTRAPDFTRCDLQEVDDDKLSANPAFTTATIDWQSFQHGIPNVNYIVAYRKGATPPASCAAASGVVVVARSASQVVQLSGLEDGQTYSVRVCAADALTVSGGITATFVTNGCAPVEHCQSGLTCTTASNQTCGTCEAGYFRDGTNRCTQCPAGSFCAAGATTPSTCANGSTSAPGATSCRSCAANQYWNGLDCVACAPGQQSAGGAVLACTDVDECASASLNDCDANAVCHNNAGGFTCSCKIDLTDGIDNNDYFGTGRTCAPVATCAAGSVVTRGPSATQDRLCAACPESHFSSTTNATQCTHFALCGPGFGYTAGSATTNSTCTACTGSTYAANRESGGTMACTAWTSCPTGSYVSSDPSASANRSCTSCASGLSTTTPNATACADITPPANPDVSVVPGRTQLVLSWPRVEDPYGTGLKEIRVAYSTSGLPAAGCGTTFDVAGNGPLATGHVITNAASGTDYSYRVCAVDNAGNVSSGTVYSQTVRTQFCDGIANCAADELHCTEAAGSEYCSACAEGFVLSGNQKACTDTTAPASPASVEATASFTTLALSWPAVTDATGSGLYGYRVASAAGNSAPDSCTASDPLTLTPSFTLTGLSNDAAYAFRVCAVDKASNLSAGVTGTGSTSACNSLPHCTGQLTCTTATDQSCGACEAGWVPNGDGICIACAAGTYKDAGDSDCVACPTDHFSAAGASACTPFRTCDAGTIYARGSATADATCTPCGVGTFSAGGTATTCTACPAGRFAATEGAGACTLFRSCGAGEGWASGTSTSDATCTACTTGTYSAGGKVACQPWKTCAAGTSYSAGSATTDATCTPCTDGTWSTGGTSTCQSWSTCGAGFGFVPGTASSNSKCVACKGTNYSTGGTMECTPWHACEPGEGYAAGTSSTDATCTACTTGTWSDGSKACAPWKNCDPGYGWSSGSAATNATCTRCDTGTFSTGGTATCATCSTCADGQRESVACSETTNRVCVAINCEAGQYWNGLACVTCATGYTSTGGYVTSCTDLDECASAGACDANATCTNAVGTFSCGCNSGFYGNGSTCTAWSSCAAGTFVSSTPSATTDRACTDCASGTFTATTNAAVCGAWTTCSAGFGYGAGTTSSDRTCTPCASGTFSNGGTASCADYSDCAPGSYVSREPSASVNRGCTACADGYSSAVSNASACVDVTPPANPDVTPVPARTTATLTWTGGVDAGVGLDHFLVSWSAGTTLPAAGCADGESVPATATSLTKRNLDQLTTYAFRVCGVDQNGNTSTGSAGTTTTQFCTAIANCADGKLTCESDTDQTCSGCNAGYTLAGNLKSCTDTSAPANPTGLAATPAHVSVSLSWNAVSDTGGTGLAGYRVAWRAGAVAPASCTAADTLTTATDIVLPSLSNASGYAWRVCAVDKAGNISSGVASSGSTLTCNSVENCAGNVTCTSATDAVCSSCAAGYALNASGTCSACMAGTFAAAGATSCSLCAFGTYSGAAAASCTAWRTCGTGYGYASGTVTQDATCSLCAAGTASAGGTDTCATCSTGSYSAAGASQCSAWQTCAAGSGYAAGTATTDATCTACTGSTYSTGGTMACTAWQTCAAGSGYTAGTASSNSSCAACPTGKYSTGGTMACTSWQSCSPGSGYTAGTTTSNATCVGCAKGTASAGGTATCDVCATGTFSGSAGASSCTAWQTCAAGYGYAAGSASSNATCAACTLNATWSAGGTNSCQALSTCATGTYVSTAANTSSDRVCTPCAAGYTTTSTNAATCVDNTPPDSPHDVTPIPAQSSITLQWNDVDDLAGSGLSGYVIAFKEGASTPPASCAAGTGVTLVSVTASSTGSYSLASATFDNTYSFTGLAATTSYSYRICSVDVAGNTSAGNTQGSYGTTATQTCTGIPRCASGLTCTTTTDQTCGACEAGWTLSADATACTDVTAPADPTGVSTTPSYVSATVSWADVTDASGSGLKGYRVAYATGTTAPQFCASSDPFTAGSSLVLTGLSNATSYAFRVCAEDVAKNLSIGVTGTVTTSTCVALANCAGTVSCTTATDSICSSCAAGFFKTGDGKCSQCAAGSYCPAGSNQGTTCASGTYSAAGAASCSTCTTACATGFHESTACTTTTNRVCTAINCAAGQYWSGSACTACPTGFTSNAGYATSCTLDVDECTTSNGGCGGGDTTKASCTNTFGGYRCDCNAGFTGNGTVCNAISCAAGQYWNGLSCTTCSAGYTSAGGYVTSCTDVNECLTNNGGCGGGSATLATCTNTTGSYSCGCNSGYFGAGTSCATWSTCAAGTYVAASGTATTDRVCVACGTGTYSSTTNAESCSGYTTCAAGQGYTAGTSNSNSSCAACSGSTWSAGGTMACTAWQSCSAGTYVSNTPSAASDRVCTTCEAGYSSTTQNAASCADVVAPQSPEFSGIVGTNSTITASWYAVTEQGSGLKHYLVATKLGSLPPSGGCAGGTQTTDTSFTLSSLSVGAMYTFRVCAVDNAGNVSSGNTVTGLTQNCPGIANCAGASDCSSGSPVCTACATGFSGSGTATCTDTTPPANTAAVTATADYTGLALSWNAVTDSTGSGLSGYRVAVAAGANAPASCSGTDVLVTGETAYSLANLPNAAAFSVRVCAEDRAGNRATGTTGTFSTLSCSAVTNCAGTVTCTTATDSVCSSCAAGSAKDTNTSSATFGKCVTCAAGTYAAAGATQCTACAAGTWSAAGAGSCSAWSTCSAGTYVSNTPTATTNRTCAACTSGTFTSAANQASCSNWSTCAAGTYVTNTPTAATDRTCAACTGSTYTSTTNAASCTAWSDCAPGTYVSTSPSASQNRVCTSCTLGTNFSTTTNAASCSGSVTVTSCTAGNGFTAATTTSNGVCTACTGSTYSTGGTMACTTRSTLSCAAGQGYTAGTASTNNSCAACTGSTYSTGGTMACTPWQTCSAGFGYAAGSASANATCTACTGTNYSTGGTMACTAWSQTSCAAGNGYAAGSASTNSTCTACNSSANGTAGKYSTGGTMACTAWQTCAAGSGYIAGTASANSTCTVCGTGKYSTGGTMACTSCAAGSSNGSTGQTSCTLCPQYTYSSAAGATSCTACAVGKYNTGTGNTAACTLSDATVPTLPDTVAATTLAGAGKLRVSWTTGTDTGGAGLRGYCVVLSTVGTTTMPADCTVPNVPAGNCVGSTCTLDFTGLAAGGMYKPRVYIIDNAGNFGKNDNGGVLYNAGCNAGNAPVATAPGSCSACTGSNWSDGSAACTAWTTCAAGTYSTTTPSTTTNRNCAACATGTYTTSANQTSCAAWTVTSCSAGFGFTAGTSTRNGSCTACASGNFSNGGTNACSACTTCTAGTSYETQACTTSQNRICGSCAACAVGSQYYWSVACGPGPTAGTCTYDNTKAVDGTLSHAKGANGGEAKLTWTAATDTGGSGVSLYRYSYLKGATAPTNCSTFDGTTTALTYTYTGLSNKNTYSYRVCAVDNAGNISTGATILNQTPK